MVKLKKIFNLKTMTAGLLLLGGLFMFAEASANTLLTKDRCKGLAMEELLNVHEALFKDSITIVTNKVAITKGYNKVKEIAPPSVTLPKQLPASMLAIRYPTFFFITFWDDSNCHINTMTVWFPLDMYGHIMATMGLKPDGTLKGRQS